MTWIQHERDWASRAISSGRQLNAGRMLPMLPAGVGGNGKNGHSGNGHAHGAPGAHADHGH